MPGICIVAKIWSKQLMHIRYVGFSRIESTVSKQHLKGYEDGIPALHSLQVSSLRTHVKSVHRLWLIDRYQW